ncbi:MAG: hypothetical protein ACPIOQ_15585, partial [Promethearchaeia archaeon]
AANVDGYQAAGRTLTEFGCKDYVVQMCNYQSKTVKYLAPVPPVNLLGQHAAGLANHPTFSTASAGR